VTHVPQFNKNLISVRALEARAWEGLLKKAFSRCPVAHCWFWRVFNATSCTT